MPLGFNILTCICGIICSETVATEKILTIGTSDGITSSSQPSSGFQSAWLGVPGHVSMADIVKKGRPHGKASATPNTSYPNDLHSYDHASKVLDMNPEPGIAAKQNVPPNDEWPLVEQLPSASVSSLLEPSADSQPFTDQSNLPLDSNQHINPQLDEAQDEDDSSDENLNEDHVISASVSSRKIQEDNSGGASLFDNDLYENMGSYQPHRHAFEHHEGDSDSLHLTLACNIYRFKIYLKYNTYFAFLSHSTIDMKDTWNKSFNTFLKNCLTHIY